jgi:hypothetical protein
VHTPRRNHAALFHAHLHIHVRLLLCRLGDFTNLDAVTPVIQVLLQFLDGRLRFFLRPRRRPERTSSAAKMLMVEAGVCLETRLFCASCAFYFIFILFFG